MYSEQNPDKAQLPPDPKTDLAKAAKPYVYDKSWKTTAQPIPKGTAEEYHEMAKQAEPALQKEMIAYCEERGLTYVVVPHKNFREDFERSPLLFRAWFDGFCARTGQNKNADIMIMTRVKELSSALRKTKDNPAGADRQKDYLAGMFLHLDGSTTPRAKKEGVARFSEALRDIEDDHRTIARNNLFHTPLAHGYRGHKAAWEISIPQHMEMGGLPILASIKTEHECAMPMDKLTRHYMNVNRETKASLYTWLDRCVSSVEDFFAASRNMKRIERRPESLNVLSRRLYDYYYAEKGFNAMLGEEAKAQHNPLALAALRVVLKTANEAFRDRNLEQTIVDLGVLPPEKSARGLRMINGGRQHNA